MPRTATVLCTAGLAVAIAALGIPASSIAGTTTTAPASTFSNGSIACAWPVESTPAKANVEYPDSNATYWTTPYVATPGLSITIKGKYPTSRYFGIDVYSSNAQTFTVNGVKSAISDYQIQPTTGSQNAWITAGAPNGGAYTVVLKRGVTSGSTNVLPIAPTRATTPLAKGMPKNTGFLMMRVYLPQGGTADNASVVPLPPLTFKDRTGTRTLTPCKNSQKTPSQASNITSSIAKAAINKALGGTGPLATKGICSGSACPAALQFFRAGGSSTPFPNAISGYAAALYTPAKGYLTIARALMPTSATAAGSAPAPWPAPDVDLRYWSVCNYVYQAPFPVVQVGRQMGCMADQQATLVNGVATIVISSPADRPAITRDPASGIGWLPTSPTNTTARELLAIRNMLPATAFAQSVTNVTTYNNPAAALAVMGVYYPTAFQCTTATFTAGGVDACLATPASPGS